MGLFAVAITTHSCQDCSKAGAAEVDIMQHMLAERNYLHFPGDAGVVVKARMQVSSVLRRKQKQKLQEIPRTKRGDLGPASLQTNDTSTAWDCLGS